MPARVQRLVREGILVEKAANGLGVGRRRDGHLGRRRSTRLGKGYGHFGIGDRGQKPIVRWRCACEQDKLRLLEDRQRGAEFESIAQEQAHGNQRRAAIVKGARGKHRVGVVQDKGRQFRMSLGEMRGQRRANPNALRDNGRCGQVARGQQVVERGGRVFVHTGLSRVRAAALAEAAVVECKNVQVEAVQQCQALDIGGEVAGAVVEKQDGRRGSRIRRHQPGREPRAAGGCGIEMYGFKRRGGGSIHVGDGVEHKLPGALPDEQADREVGAKNGRENGEADRFQEPDRIDGIGLGPRPGRSLGTGVLGVGEAMTARS